MAKKNPEEGKFSYEGIVKKYKKPKYEKYFIINRTFYRPIASLVVKFLFNTRITPNQLTVLSFFFGLLAAASFVLGKHVYLIIGAIILQVSQIMDAADGTLARAKNISIRNWLR